VCNSRPGAPQASGKVWRVSQQVSHLSAAHTIPYTPPLVVARELRNAAHWKRNARE